MRGFVAIGLLLFSPLLARAADYHGRGVYYFDGPVRSPVAGVGSRGEFATNRLALDDDHTTVAVDPVERRIVFTNAHSYDSSSIVGDVVLLGTGLDEKGARVPFGVHLEVRKRGRRFTAQVHPHPTSRDKVTDVQLAEYTVVARDRDETVLLTPAQSRRAIEEPELTARLAKIFIQATDHLDGQTIHPEVPDTRLVDVSIGFGVSKLKLDVGRIELISRDPDNATLIRQASVGSMLARGEWDFRITSETWLPPQEFERDLFLFGLDSVPFLQPLKKRGLARGESLVIGFRGGRGYVQLGDDRAEIAAPSDVARSYLEFHFIGGLVARQVANLPQRIQ